MSEADRGQIITLAEDVLDIARNRLLMNLRYLDMALTFHRREVYDGSLSVSGSTLYYGPAYVLRLYRESKAELTRAYLHAVLHCVFMHPFACGGLDRVCWDLACDIAVESTVNELGLRCAVSERTDRQTAVTERIRRSIGFLTAEKIYAGLRNGSLDPDTLAAGFAGSGEGLAMLEELFRADDHTVWYAGSAEDDQYRAAPGADAHMISSAPPDSAGDDWKAIAEQVMMDIEVFAKVRGRYASSMIQNLRAVVRERHDYAAFLRTFASTRETVKVSDDEYDNIYYYYGLTHYGNMPLIEPLEYRDDNRIRDFVVAVDTSGSVAGEEVQSFIRKTYDILSQRGSFREKINVHIIQCDAEIQEDKVITCREDLERYMETMQIRGLGGTDLRPVFEYVDRLIAEGGFKDLRGLIYFTDGLGTFPPSKPDYRTAFIFIEDGYDIPEVPPWAIRLVLRQEEI